MPRTLALIVLTAACGWGSSSLAEDPAQRQLRLLRQIELLTRVIATDTQLLRSAEAQSSRRLEDYELAAAASRRAQQQAGEVKASLESARQTESQLFRQLKDRIKDDPEAVAARQELLAAQKMLDEQRDRILSPLRESDEHVAATKALAAARGELDQARGAGKSPEHLAPLISRTQDLANGLSSMEAQALRSDDGYIAAEEQVKEARAALAEVTRKITDQIRVDEERLAAVEAIDEARKQFAAAEKAADQARRRSDTARRAALQAEDACSLIRRRIETNQRLLQQYEAELSGRPYVPTRSSRSPGFP